MLDAQEIAILGALQQDARLTVADACWSIAGSTDFLLQVVSPDLDTYAEFAMTVIRRLPGIKAMHTTFTLKELKAPGPWPIPR